LETTQHFCFVKILTSHLKEKALHIIDHGIVLSINQNFITDSKSIFKRKKEKNKQTTKKKNHNPYNPLQQPYNFVT